MITDPETKARACATVESGVLAWMTASQHSKASRLFCETFDQTISEVSLPAVASYCLGRYNHRGEKTSEGLVPSREAEIQAREPKARKMQEWLQKAGCGMPPVLPTGALI